MKVLQVIPRLDVGGVETGTVDLAKKLCQTGHEAVVISSGGKLVENLKTAGAKHYELPVERKSIFTIFSCVSKVAEIIKNEKIDVAHARSRVPAWISFFACRMTNTPFVTSCHGYYSRHFFSRVMGWGKFVIVISKFIGRHMTSNFGVPLQRIKLIPRGIDLEKYTFKKPEVKQKGDYVVGVVARLTPLKGHENFIKAFSIVARKMPKVKAWIIGDAPQGKEDYKKYLVSLAQNSGISKNIEFLGNRDDVPQLLSKLDLLVLPTTAQEGFGRVIVEANAAGVPVVATKVGGIVEIIDENKTGILVPVGEPGTMAGAIETLLKDRNKAIEFALKAREKAENEFSLYKMVESTIEVYKEAVSLKRILVIKISALGDVILAVPSLKAIRDKFKGAHISVLASRACSQVLNNCPYIDEIIILDRKNEKVGLARVWEISKELRRNNFDIAVDLQNSAKSHLLAYLSLAPKRYGYHNGKLSFLLNEKIDGAKLPIPPVEHQFRVLNLLGVKENDSKLELWPSELEQSYVEELFADKWVGDHQMLIGINLGASKKWLTKRWPLENIVKLSDRLIEKLSARIVITGSKDDAALAERFRAKAKYEPIIAVGKTSPMQLAALIKKCNVYVTSDSAPMHIAAAVRTPFVAMFGPTDPKRHVPPAEKYIVIDKNINCAPCYKSNCGKAACMKTISVEEVFSAVERLKNSNESIANNNAS